MVCFELLTAEILQRQLHWKFYLPCVFYQCKFVRLNQAFLVFYLFNFSNLFFSLKQCVHLLKVKLLHKNAFSSGEVSQDGRYLVVEVSKGCDPTNSLYYYDLHAANNEVTSKLDLKPLFDKNDAKYEVSGFFFSLRL